MSAFDSMISWGLAYILGMMIGIFHFIIWAESATVFRLASSAASVRRVLHSCLPNRRGSELLAHALALADERKLWVAVVDRWEVLKREPMIDRVARCCSLPDPLVIAPPGVPP